MISFTLLYCTNSVNINNKNSSIIIDNILYINMIYNNLYVHTHTHTRKFSYFFLDFQIYYQLFLDKILTNAFQPLAANSYILFACVNDRGISPDQSRLLRENKRGFSVNSEQSTINNNTLSYRREEVSRAYSEMRSLTLYRDDRDDKIISEYAYSLIFKLYNL